MKNRKVKSYVTSLHESTSNAFGRFKRWLGSNYHLRSRGPSSKYINLSFISSRLFSFLQLAQLLKDVVHEFLQIVILLG